MESGHLEILYPLISATITVHEIRIHIICSRVQVNYLLKMGLVAVHEAPVDKWVNSLVN